MPTLPTVTVTAAQATRMLAVFGDVAGYKKWLVSTLREYVIAVETRALDETANATKRAAIESARAALPDPDTAA